MTVIADCARVLDRSRRRRAARSVARPDGPSSRLVGELLRAEPRRSGAPNGPSGTRAAARSHLPRRRGRHRRSSPHLSPRQDIELVACLLVKPALARPGPRAGLAAPAHGSRRFSTRPPRLAAVGEDPASVLRWPVHAIQPGSRAREPLGLGRGSLTDDPRARRGRRGATVQASQRLPGPPGGPRKNTRYELQEARSAGNKELEDELTKRLPKTELRQQQLARLQRNRSRTLETPPQKPPKLRVSAPPLILVWTSSKPLSRT